MIGPLAFLPLAQAHIVRPPDRSLAWGEAPELLLLAALALALLFLMRPGRRRRAGDRATGARWGRTGAEAKPNRDRNWILVDGSNVMHWEDNTPHIEPVRRVVSALKAQGLDPGVVFDANVGWKLVGRYLGERELCKLLDLPQDQVLVVPKGNQADPWLLTTARDFHARIVTNDRFRDWAEAHPEVTEPGFLVRGSLTGDTVWLEGMAKPDAATTH
jgi:Zc3h12a-like Ribonuclease NYN domain